MNITIINQGDTQVPVTHGSTNDEVLAWVAPEAAYVIESDDLNVVSIGDNPSFAQEVAEATEAIKDKLASLLVWWTAHKGTVEADDAMPHIISIANNGTNSLRILLGSNVEERFLAAGAAGDFELGRYIEVREQGV